MNRKYRRKQFIIIVALILVMCGLSLGYAAFSSALTIESSASVSPNSSGFNIVFSASGTSQVSGSLSATDANGASSESATISGTTISGLKANFTEPGQSVTYNFYIHNDGAYIGYLKSIVYGNVSDSESFKVCSAISSETSSDLVTEACDAINVTVSLRKTVTSSTIGVVNNPVLIGEYLPIEVMISYDADGGRADGDFNVEFGDISLKYSSAAGTNTYYFSISGYTGLRAFYEGMTWNDLVSNNSSTYYIEDNYVYLSSVKKCFVGVNADDYIQPGTYELGSCS